MFPSPFADGLKGPTPVLASFISIPRLSFAGVKDEGEFYGYGGPCRLLSVAKKVDMPAEVNFEEGLAAPASCRIFCRVETIAAFLPPEAERLTGLFCRRFFRESDPHLLLERETYMCKECPLRRPSLRIRFRYLLLSGKVHEPRLCVTDDALRSPIFTSFCHPEACISK